jgi:hypothetical protein
MGAFDGVRDKPVVLVALALPSLFRVREAGRALRCLSSTSGHATMLHAYAHENRDLLPWAFPYDGRHAPRGFFGPTERERVNLLTAVSSLWYGRMLDWYGRLMTLDDAVSLAFYVDAGALSEYGDGLASHDFVGQRLDHVVFPAQKALLIERHNLHDPAFDPYSIRGTPRPRLCHVLAVSGDGRLRNSADAVAGVPPFRMKPGPMRDAVADACKGGRTRRAASEDATGRAGSTHSHFLPQCPNRFRAANMPCCSKYARASSTVAKMRVAVWVMKGLGALRGRQTT